MNILAVIERELRVLCRKRSVYVVRTLFTAAILLTWACCRGFMDSDLYDLTMMSFVALILFGFGAAIAPSDAIGSERRNRTLGLLLLTPLRPLEVLFGKLFSCISQYLLCLVAILPVLALPLLGGGVEGAAVVRHFIGVLAVSLLGMSIGLAASVLCRRAVASATLSFTAMLLLFLVPIFCAGLLDTSRGFRSVDFFWLGPLYLPLLEVSSRTITGIPVQFGSWLLNLAIVLGLGLGFLLAAAALFPLIWRRERQPAGGAKRRKDPRVRPSAPVGDGENPLRFIRRRIGFAYPAFSGLAVLVCAGSALSVFVDGEHWGRNLEFSYLSGLILLPVIYWRCSLEASSPVHRLRQSGMLEPILVTPLSRRSLHSGLRLLAGDPLRWNGLLLLVGNGALAMAALFVLAELDPYDAGYFTHVLVPLHLGVLALLPLELASLRAAGTWRGLRSGSPLKAAAILFLSHGIAPGVLLVVWIAVEESGAAYGWHLCRAAFFVAILLWCRRRVRQWIARGSPPAGRSVHGPPPHP